MSRGKFRAIQDQFWQDDFILDLSPEEDRFYNYLLTNNFVKQVGIYELPMRMAETQLKHSKEKILKLMEKFEDYGKIKYNPQTKEVALKNWAKYNFATGNILICINKEINNVKDKSLIPFVYSDFEFYKDYIPLLNDLQEYYKTLQDPSRPFQESIETLQDPRINNKNKNNNKNNNKNKKEEKLLFENEFEELWKEYPRKEGKSESLKSYIKNREKYDKEQLITAISNYKKYIELKKYDYQYTKKGSTFFSGDFEPFIDGVPGNGKPKEIDTRTEEEVMRDELFGGFPPRGEEQKRMAEEWKKNRILSNGGSISGNGV